MIRITAWLEKKFAPRTAIAETGKFHIPVGIKVTLEAKEKIKEDSTVEVGFDAAVSGRIDSYGPGKNVLMPDIDGDGHDVTKPNPKIIDLRSPGDIESTRFNPYDTVVMH